MIVADFDKEAGPFLQRSAVGNLHNGWWSLSNHGNLPGHYVSRPKHFFICESQRITRILARSTGWNGVPILLRHAASIIIRIWYPPRRQELFFQVTVQRAFCSGQMRWWVWLVGCWSLLPLNHVSKIYNVWFLYTSSNLSCKFYISMVLPC